MVAILSVRCPASAITSLMLPLESSSVFFGGLALLFRRQARVGKGRRPYFILKFIKTIENRFNKFQYEVITLQ